MIETIHTIEKTTTTEKVAYQFDVDKYNNDQIKIIPHLTCLELEVGGETLINIGLSAYAKICVKIVIDVNNAP